MLEGYYMRVDDVPDVQGATELEDDIPHELLDDQLALLWLPLVVAALHILSSCARPCSQPLGGGVRLRLWDRVEGGVGD
jgi:hypothetical protein